MVNPVEEIFGFMQSHFIPGNAIGVDAVFQLNLSGARTYCYYVVVKNQECQIKEGVHRRPTVNISGSLEDLVSIVKGKVRAKDAFSSDKMWVSGDLMLAQRFQRFFKPITTEDASWYPSTNPTHDVEKTTEAVKSPASDFQEKEIISQESSDKRELATKDQSKHVSQGDSGHHCLSKYLDEKQVVRMLLVRAVEEGEVGVFSREAKSNANSKAREEQTELAALSKRAECLFGNIPKSLKEVGRVALGWMHPLVVAVIILGPVLGMASNFLGHSSQVHIVKNPIVFLIFWNLGVYVVLSLLWLYRRSHTRRSSSLARPDAAAERNPQETHKVESANPSHDRSAPREDYCISTPEPPAHDLFLVRYFLQPVFKLVFRKLLEWKAHFYEKAYEWRDRFDQEKEVAEKWKKTLNSFFSNYLEAAKGVVEWRLHYLLHLLNVGLVIGAIVGTYMRGLFFEYNAVWESTFIHDPGTLAALLNAVFGVPSLIIDGRWLMSADVAPLLQSQGALAGPWIHKLALTATILVVIPRFILMLGSHRRAKLCANNLNINLSEPYYRNILHHMHGMGLEGVGEELDRFVREETDKLAEDAAKFVTERFFDQLVVKSLTRFRTYGGRLKDLELELVSRVTQFEPVMKAYLTEAQRNFSEQLLTWVSKKLHGQSLAIHTEAIRDVQDTITQSGQKIAGSINLSGGILDFILGCIAAFTVGFVAAAGTMTLGVGALVIGGAVLLYGRQNITEKAKTLNIPASLTKRLLRDSKIQESRDKLFQMVRDQVKEQYESQIGVIHKEILSAVSDVIDGRS